MISSIEKYLKNELEHAGIPRKHIYFGETYKKQLKPKRYAIVVFSPEDLARSGRKVASETIPDQKVIKLVEKFTREGEVLMGIGAERKPALEKIVKTFLEGIDLYIKDTDGNSMELEPLGIDWEGEKSILRKQRAVEILIRFRGGIYKKTEVGVIKGVDVPVAPGT